MKNKILLINTSFRKNCSSEYSSFGPPMGLLTISSALKAQGYEVELIDPQLEPDYLGQLNRALAKPLLFVGMSSYLGENIRNAVEISQLIKTQKPDLPLVVGGPLATSIPEIFFKQMPVDYIVMGSGETTVVELASALQSSSSSVNHPNLSYMDNDRLVVGEMPEFVGHLDELPQPDIEAWAEGVKRLGRIPIITSRGCDRGCSFCYNTFTGRRSYYLRTPENVIDEMKRWSQRFDVRVFEFYDDNFLLDPQRALTILNEMKKNKWRANRLFGHLDEFDFVRPEQLSGIVDMLIMCIESASPRIQKILNKKIDIEKALKLVAEVSRQKIRFVTAFMFGIPGETDDELCLNVETAERIRAVNEHNVSMCYIYAPQPKDAIVRRMRNEHNIDFSLDAVAEVETVPVPPDNKLDLRLRPWMNSEDQTFYLDFVLVWQYYFAGYRSSDFELESVFARNERVCTLFSNIALPKTATNNDKAPQPPSLKSKIWNVWNSLFRF